MPRPPARPVQPEPPRPPAPVRAPALDPAEVSRHLASPGYVVVLWISPQLRERDPGQPRSLHEALQAGRPFDPRFPLPGPALPGPDADREAEP